MAPIVTLLILCSGATRRSPCESRAPSSLSSEHKARLCEAAPQGSEAPAICAKAAPRRISFDALLLLCRGAPEVRDATKAPVACFKAAAARFRGAEREVQRAHLCASATSNMPAKCALALRTGTEPEIMVELCRGARSTAPAACFRAVRPAAALEDEQKAELCRSARAGRDDDGNDLATLPARCVGHAALRKAVGASARQDASDLRLRLKLCGQATSLAPLRCVKHAPSWLGIAQRLRLCDGASGTGEGPTRCAAAAAGPRSSSVPAGVAAEVVELCRGSPHAGPGECVAAAPRIILRAAATAVATAAAAAKRPKPKTRARASTTAAAAAAPKLLVTLCRNAPPGGGPSLCMSALKGQLGKLGRPAMATAMAKLCAGASSAAPALCANAAPFTLDPDTKAAICSGAAAGGSAADKAAVEGPAKCVAAVLGYNSVEGRTLARLCRGAPSEAPAFCFNAVRHSDGGGNLPPAAVAELCRSDASDAQQDDMGRMYTWLDPEEVRQAARDSKESLPVARARLAAERVAACVAELPAGMMAGNAAGGGRAHSVVARRRGRGGKGMTAAERAEEEAQDAAAAEAAAAAERRQWNAVVRLCRGAHSSAPARCSFSPAIRGLGFSWEQRSTLCKGAVEKLPQTDDAVGIDGAPEYRAVSGGTLAPWAAPAECAAIANRAAGRAGGDEGEFSHEERVALCAGALSTAPALCAAELVSEVPKSQRVALCRGHIKLTTAHCANAAVRAHHDQASHLRAGRSLLDAGAISRCRAARAVPSKLEVESTESGDGIGRPLLPSSNITVNLRVLDQFGQPHSGRLSPLDKNGAKQPLRVRVSLDPKGSDGAIIIGQKVQDSGRGKVRFEGLRMSQPGNFTLYFDAANAPNDAPAKRSGRQAQRQHSNHGPNVGGIWQVKGAVVYVAVSMPVRQRFCENLYEKLQCFVDDAKRRENNSTVTGDNREATEAAATANASEAQGAERPVERIDVGTIYARIPSHLAVPLVASCNDYLKDSAAVVIWSAAVRRGQPTLAIRASAWKLLRNVGLPKPDEDMWERLRLKSTDFLTGGMSSRQIRGLIRKLKKSYHAHSLEWHPDRWVALPLPMQGRAARVFSLVSEAYAAISKGLVEQQRAAERLETTGDSSGSDDSALPDTILIGYGRVGCDDGSTRCKVH